MFLSALFILRTLSKERKLLPSGVKGLPLQPFLFFGTMVLATAFFNQLGYPLFSFLLMVALLKILGMKKWGLNILLSFITALVSYFLFVQWLKIPLPKGLLGL